MYVLHGMKFAACGVALILSSVHCFRFRHAALSNSNKEAHIFSYAVWEALS